MFTKKFLQSLAERGLKTLAQALVATLAVSAAAGGGLLNVDWVNVLSVGGLATLISVLMNVTIGAASDGNPSIGSVETVDEEPAVAPRRAWVEDDAPVEGDEFGTGQ